MMTRVVLGLLIGCVLWGCCPAWSQDCNKVAFDEASVRAAPPDHGFTTIGPFDSMHFTARNVSLSLLIQMAFRVDGEQLKFKQDWIGTTVYDITTSWGSIEKPSEQATREALRCLLSSRFGLEAHRETVVRSGFALKVAKTGILLKKASSASSGASLLPTKIVAEAVTLRTLAGLVAIPLGRPVVDDTGVPGTFRVHLSFAGQSESNESLPTLPTALIEQAGLRLEKRNIPVEMLIVDAAKRPVQE